MSLQRKKKTVVAKKKTKAVKKPKVTPVQESPSEPKAIVVEPKTIEEAQSDPKSEEESKEEEEKKMEQRLDDYIETLKEFKAMTRGMCNDFIDVLSDAKREIRQLRKTQKKPRVKKEPQKPSVFETPVPISDALADFLEVEHGTVLSRNEVTHHIHTYCDDHHLMNTEDRRIIHPDDAMKAILKNPPKKLTWLNLQSYIKHHYK